MSETSGQLCPKTRTFFGTLNINSLLRAGKLQETITDQTIQILVLQETRLTDNNAMDFGNYRLQK
ncbi:MAG: hypothetical protein ACTS8Y_03550 [Arsenophonus sp. ER-EMS1-MAG3]